MAANPNAYDQNLFEEVSAGDYDENLYEPVPEPPGLLRRAAGTVVNALTAATGHPIGVKKEEPPMYDESLYELVADGSSVLRRAGDVGISLVKGAISVPEAVVGLADIPTMGYAGKATEAAGFRPKEAKAILDEYLSPEQVAANKAVSDAEGFVPTLEAAVENPSVIAHAAVESLPAMGAGGVVARALPLAPWAAAAIGEGTVSGGLAAEQIRQTTDTGLLTPGQAASAMASGVGTTAFGALGGKLSRKLGITDVDTLLAGGAVQASHKNIVRRMVEGGISEGAFEELPQSVQEQIWQNAALDRPLMTDVPENAAIGLLTGTAMGGGASAVFNRYATTQPPSPSAVAPPGAPPIAGEQTSQSTPDLLNRFGIAPSGFAERVDSSQPPPAVMGAQTVDEAIAAAQAHVDAPVAPGMGEAQNVGNGQQTTQAGEVEQPIEAANALSIQSLRPVASIESIPQSPGEQVNGQLGKASNGLPAVPSGSIAPIETTQVAAPSGKQQAKTDDLLASNTANAEGAPDTTLVNAKVLGDTVNGEAFRKQGFRGLDIKTQDRVLEAMSGLAENLQILNAVIPSIPVNVMNVLASQQLTPKMLFHDKAMLFDWLASGRIGNANVGLGGDPIHAMASIAAKGVLSADSSAEMVRLSGNKPTALNTGELNRGPEANPTTSNAAKDLGGLDVSQPSGEMLPTGEAGTINLRHDVTPSGDVGLGAVGAKTPAVPPIVSQPTPKEPAVPATGIRAEIASIEKARQRRVEQRPGERRHEPDFRASVEGMSPEQLRAEVEAHRVVRLTNPLTGLPNKTAFEEDAALGFDTVAAMDIDGFGFLNDVWGHQPVDAILKQIGDEIAQFAGGDVLIYHRSGDEFAARGKDAQAVEQTLKSLQDHLEKAIFTVPGVTASGENITLIKHGIGITYGIDQSYEAADRRASAAKERRVIENLRSPKGFNPGGMAEQSAGGIQTDLGARGLSKDETLKLREAAKSTKESVPSATSSGATGTPQGGMQERAVRADESGSPELAQAKGAAGDAENISTIPVIVEARALSMANRELEVLNKRAIDDELRDIEMGSREGANITELAKNPVYWDAENEQLSDAGYAEYDQLNHKIAAKRARSGRAELLADLNDVDKTVQVEAFDALADGLGFHTEKSYSTGGSRYVEVRFGDDGQTYKFRFADHYNTVRDTTMQPDFNVAPGGIDFTEAVDALLRLKPEKATSDANYYYVNGDLGMKSDGSFTRDRRHWMPFNKTDAARMADSNAKPYGATTRGVFVETVSGDRLKLPAKPVTPQVPTRTPSKAEPQQAPSEEGVSASGVDQTKPYTLEEHGRVAKRIRAGDITAEELKATYRRAVASADALKADLSTRTIKELAPRGAGGAKKSEIVRSIVDQMLSRFIVGKTFTWSPFSETAAQARARTVESITDEDIQKAVKERKDAIAEHEKAITNPETISEFRTFVDVKGDDALTPEQRIRYEELQAERGIKFREQDKERNAQVQAAGEKVGTKIVETKHTKKGHDLFVVQLEKRVERDDYTRLNTAAKKLGGYYSSFRGVGAVPGFQFTAREAAEAFQKVATEGDTQAATEMAQARRETRGDERAQTAAQKLKDMAETLEAKAQESLGRDRLSNTSRRAQFAASAEAKATGEAQLAKTMRSLAQAIESGEAKHLSELRTKVQVEMLNDWVRSAKGDELRAKYESYSEQERHKGEPATEETAGYANYPDYTIPRDHLLSLVGKMRDIDGLKQTAQRLSNEARAAREGERVTVPANIAESAIAKLRAHDANLTGYGKLTPWHWETASDKIQRLNSMGITDQAMLRAALREFINYRAERQKADPIKQMERDLVGTKIPGFFPTPPAVVERMMEAAAIEPGMKVLEPSAGKGNIADTIREAEPGAELEVVEYNSTLRKILEAKGYPVVGTDFLEHAGQYDRIVMNPPFEDGQDIDHVRHAYDLLKPGGRVVAIMSQGPFFRSDKQATAFRAWLDDIGGTSEPIESGAFMDKREVRTTGVSSQLVVIDKADQEPRLSRQTEPAAGGFSASEAKKAIAPIVANWTNGPEINVVQSVGDLPGYLQESIKSIQTANAEENIEGLFDPRTDSIFLVADNLENATRAQETILHEAIGHYGLRGLLGKDLNPLLQQVYLSYGRKGLKDIADLYGLDLNTSDGRLTAAEEKLARIAETGEKPGLVQRLYALIRDWLRRMGFDVKLNDADLKAIVARAGKFIEGERTTAASAEQAPAYSQAAPMFYSQMQRVLTDKLPGSAPAQLMREQIGNMAKSGAFKKEEYDWSGIDQYLADQTGKVTKQQIQDFMRANETQIKEVILGQRDGDIEWDGNELMLKGETVAFISPGKDSGWDVYDSYVGKVEEGWLGYSTSKAEAKITAERFARQGNANFTEADQTTKFNLPDLVLPGGENYRELLLMLPDEGGKALVEGRAAPAEGFRQNFRSSHFDEPNVLAHVRFNERWQPAPNGTSIKLKDGKAVPFVEGAPWKDTDERGFKTLFVEEVQSDWHQKGRKQGYDLGKPQFADGMEGQEQGFLGVKAQGVPDAPFKTTWPMLAMKRMIRYASENGYDKIAWTTGEQQAGRYDLSKVIDSVRVHKIDYPADRAGWHVEANPRNGSGQIRKVVQTESELADVIGKDLAEKAVKKITAAIEKWKSLEPSERATFPDAWEAEYSGLELKVGGEGMKAFYDKMLPNEVNKYVKKWGAKVDETRIDIAPPMSSEETNTVLESLHRSGGQTDEDAFRNYKKMETVHSLEITPAMRESAMAGQPLFSLRDMKPAEMAQRTRSEIGNLLESDRTFNRWWHTTVGTQFHKAQIDQDFGKVFNLGQDYLTDFSRYAMMAESEAPDLLTRMEGLRDVFRFGAKKSDVQTVSGAIFEGTLDEKVFSEDQLKDRGMTDKQIEYYVQARAAIGNSLDELAKSIMAKQARAIGIEGSFIDGLRRQDTSLHDFHSELLGVMKLREKGYRELAKGVEGRLKSDFEAQARAAADQIKATVNVFNRAAELKSQGYAPLMRFGQYTVSVSQLADGEREEVFFGMYETQAAANRAAQELANEFPNTKIEKGILSQEAWRVFRGISPETIAVFAQAVGLDQDAAFQDYLKLAVNSRSAMKRMIHRKGTPGFSEDLQRVLAAFITSNARLTSSNYHLGDMQKAVDAIPREKGDVKDEAVKLWQYLIDPKEEAGKLRGFLFFNFLGGSVASGMVNATQPIMITAPYLAQFTSVKNVSTELGVAMKDAVLNETPADMATDYQRAVDEGIIAPHEIYQLMAAARNSVGRSTVIARGMRVWGAFFSLAEAFNRRTTFIAAYRIAKKLDKADPYEFAKQAIYETQFVYNKGNRPDWARGTIGATIFTFKQFSISYIEAIKRMPPAQRAMALMLLWFMTGLKGLPFADDLGDMVDTIGQWLGHDTNSDKWLRKIAVKTLGNAGAEFMLHGVTALPGVPLDLQARFSMGNLIPGTSLLKPSETNKTRDIQEFLGPAGGVAGSIGGALESAAKGDAAGAGRKLLPTSVQSALKGMDMWETGTYRDTKGRKVRDVSKEEAILKMAGFQPSEVAKESRVIRENQQDISLQHVVEAGIADKWATGIVEKDKDKIAEARQEMKDWNAKNPETRVMITPQQIERRVIEMRKSKGQRFNKSVPPEMRGRITREMREAQEE